MLEGTLTSMRPVRESDLAELYECHLNIADRGDFFPRGVVSQPAFNKRYAETGFWTREDGTLVVRNRAGEIIGHVEFFKTVNYLDELELSCTLYRPEACRQGAMTEAVNLVVRYLFETKNVNRIRLVIHTGNAASRRLAEKCGFKHEGTARGAWYNKAMHHDVEIYSILRNEVITG